MDCASSREASNGDLRCILDHKSKKITDLEKLVTRLSTALLSLEEENLNLHKKLRENQALGSHRDEMSLDLDKPEKDNQVALDLDLTENKSKEVPNDYGDLRAAPESVDWTNQQPGNKGQRRLEEKVILLREEANHLKEELQIARRLQGLTLNEKTALENDAVDHLEQENSSLREILDKSCLVARKAQRRAENLQEQQVELERCLVLLQTEKNLLQDELRNLHQEYVRLSKTMEMHLRDTRQAGNLTELLFAQREGSGRDVLVGHKVRRRSPCRSPPKRGTTFGEMNEKKMEDGGRQPVKAER